MRRGEKKGAHRIHSPLPRMAGVSRRKQLFPRAQCWRRAKYTIQLDPRTRILATRAPSSSFAGSVRAGMQIPRVIISAGGRASYGVWCLDALCASPRHRPTRTTATTYELRTDCDVVLCFAPLISLCSLHLSSSSFLLLFFTSILWLCLPASRGSIFLALLKCFIANLNLKFRNEQTRSEILEWKFF